MPTLPIPLSVLTLVVYATMLVGLGLIVFVPFFPGVAVIFGAVVVYVGCASYLAHDFAGISYLGAGFATLFAFGGIFSSFWTEKLGIRYTYVSQQVMWGAIIASMVIGMALPGLFWFMIGMVIGAIAMEVKEGRGFPAAVREGVAAVYTMLGPRGFQLVMAMLIISVASPPMMPLHLTPAIDNTLQAPRDLLLASPSSEPTPGDQPSSLMPPEEMPPDEPKPGGKTSQPDHKATGTTP